MNEEQIRINSRRSGLIPEVIFNGKHYERWNPFWSINNFKQKTGKTLKTIKNSPSSKQPKTPPQNNLEQPFHKTTKNTSSKQTNPPQNNRKLPPQNNQK